MLYEIKNDQLKVVVSSRGAEIMSIKTPDETEYMWQADPKYWGHHSVTIFPYVGRLTEGKYSYHNDFYHLPNHGIARAAEFSAIQVSKNSLKLTLNNPDQYRNQYPFTYSFSVYYYLNKNYLFTRYSVINQGIKTMYFAVGGHPAINVPLEKNLVFEDYKLHFSESNLTRIKLSDECFITNNEQEFALRNNELPLIHSLFDNDAIVLKGQYEKVTLLSEKGTHSVSLYANGFPYLGLWHKACSDAPYICLEPWSALPSRQGIIEDLETQPDLTSLPANESFEATWSLCIN